MERFNLKRSVVLGLISFEASKISDVEMDIYTAWKNIRKHIKTASKESIG
jgi:hypothetical protein